jgi:hypothetical protein
MAAPKVFQWIKYTLPAKGYFTRYAGHPQLHGQYIEGLGFTMMAAILSVLETLEIAAPLDKQCVVPNVMAE